MARVALVTGGSRGIGAAISKALQQAGCKVAANYAGNDEAAATFKAESGIPVFKWDAADAEACKAGIAKVEAELGPVEILVNNAGITRDAAFHRMSLEQWQQVMATNVDSLFTMTRPVWEGMRARKFGRVINISSVTARRVSSGRPTTRPPRLRRSASPRRWHKKVLPAGLRSTASAPAILAPKGPRRTRGCAEGEDPAADPGRPPRRAGGDRPLRGIPGQREAGFITGSTLSANGGQYLA